MRIVFTLSLLLLAACQTDSADYPSEMRDQHDGDVPTATGATGDADTTGLITERVTYATVEGEDITGYLAQPEILSDSLQPAVIVIQEWWGLNENIEAMARKLAAEGYVALAVDLYGGEVADTPDGAMALMQTAMSQEAALTDNLKQAYAFLTDRGVTSVGTIGWCFGGMWSLRTALALPEEIDGSVIYYGRPVTDADELATLQMPILAFFGGADDSIPQETVAAFETALAEAGVDHEVEVYPGTAHAFANPSGQAYDAAAAEDAWARTVAFFDTHLR
ncbi:MAG: dienelactone hydrolase family protein [Rubricoccaceae bacterium]